LFSIATTTSWSNEAGDAADEDGSHRLGAPLTKSRRAIAETRKTSSKRFASGLSDGLPREGAFLRLGEVRLDV
jgi:hypothetical protein